MSYNIEFGKELEFYRIILSGSAIKAEYKKLAKEILEIIINSGCPKVLVDYRLFTGRLILLEHFDEDIESKLNLDQIKRKTAFLDLEANGRVVENNYNQIYLLERNRNVQYFYSEELALNWLKKDL